MKFKLILRLLRKINITMQLSIVLAIVLENGALTFYLPFIYLFSIFMGKIHTQYYKSNFLDILNLMAQELLLIVYLYDMILQLSIRNPGRTLTKVPHGCLTLPFVFGLWNSLYLCFIKYFLNQLLYHVFLQTYWLTAN